MKANLSRIYILPLLDEFLGFESRYIGNIRNTFLINSETDEPTFSILHKFNYKDLNFPIYERKLLDNPLFIKSIDKGENVIYIFKFPEKYLKEYMLFKKSIYSEFSETAKSVILAFWLRIYRGRPVIYKVIAEMRQVLYKNDILRQQLEKDLKVKISPMQELGEYIDLDKELLTI